MSLAVGSRLGVFQITSVLGAGGMGTVYRATDTSLGRQVAIKVLPDAVATDPDRLARFEREAKTLAALNHPHIAAIYAVEKSAGVHALVMELVEGEDLSARIARGPLPLDEALPIAKQIAEALEAAHEQGIIHRDLKPANIKVRDDGTVKVLDFGLAKAIEGAGQAGGHDVTQSLTMAPATTQAGIILGTAAYMSPEQARGRLVDKRTDIWSFGCVLYEMLAAKCAFAGEDVADTIVSVISKEADLSAIPASVPARVTQAVKVCLRKDPKQRAGDIRDVRLALEGAFETAVAVPSPSATGATRGRSMWLALGMTALAALVLGAGSVTWFRTKTVESEPRVFQVESGDGISAPKVSPDGRSVAFAKSGHLAVRSLDTGKTLDLAETNGASNPFWSPDSRTVAFFAQTAIAGRVETRIFAVPASGGAIRTMAANAFAPFGASWGPGGIVFVRNNQGLWLVPDGGQARPFATIDTAAGEQNLAFPSALPDGRVLAVMVRSDRNVRSLVVVGEGRQSTLLDLSDEAPFWPVMVGSHTVLFQRQGASTGIWKVEVNTNLSSASGAPVPVFPDGSVPSVSSDGMLVALSGVRQGDRQLVWVDRTGHSPTRFGRAQGGFFRSPSVSPDGLSVAVGNAPFGVTALSSSNAIWLLQQATSQRVPLGAIGGTAPAWAPTGNRIAFLGVSADRNPALFVVPASSTGEPQFIVRATVDGGGSLAWSPDTRSLVYGNDGDLWTIDAAPGATPRRLVKNARHPAISPDGHFLAYSSATTGREEVYLTTLPTSSSVWPVSGDGGRYPRWNPRGGELFFASGPNVQDDPNSYRDISVVKIDTMPSVKIGTPETLFDAFALGYRTNAQGFRGFEIAPDGQRILVQTTGVSGTPTITAIQHIDAWMARQH